MSDTKTKARPAAGYDADFHAWTQDQAARLRTLRPDGIDWANLAEEIETLGRSDKREIRSRMLILLIHLLKWRYQPDLRGNSWRASIAGARDEILDELASSPSLRRYPAAIVDRQYALARLDASGDTGLALDTFPEACPFAIGEILDPDFWPDVPT